MKRALGIAVGVVALVYAGICGFMFSEQRALIYHPTPASELPGAESIAFKSGDETLRLWSRPHEGTRALIYFGGNGEDVAHNFERFASAMPDRAIVLVNYRGYGGSTGAPTEAGLFADALAIFDDVRARHAEVAVVGRSLGTGVAVYLAANRPVHRLVLVTPYDSIEHVAQGRYPFLPVGLVLQDKFDSASRVPAVKARTLVLLAESDDVVPLPFAQALIEKFPQQQIQVETIRGTSHNSIGRAPEYPQAIAAFLH